MIRSSIYAGDTVIYPKRVYLLRTTFGSELRCTKTFLVLFIKDFNRPG